MHTTGSTSTSSSGKQAHRQSFVGAIDQGTTSSRFIIFDQYAKIVASHQLEFPQSASFPPCLSVCLQLPFTRYSFLWC